MELSVVYNLTELRALAAQFPDVVREETETVLKIVVARLEKDVEEGTPAGVGGVSGLRGSIHGQVVNYGGSLAGIVGTPLAHGEVIELGRRPGKRRPPVEALIPWVRSIIGITDEKEQRGVAFAIARKIGAEGFKGAHMFGKAWGKDLPWVQAMLYTIGARVAKRLST